MVIGNVHTVRPGIEPGIASDFSIMHNDWYHIPDNSITVQVMNIAATAAAIGIKLYHEKLQGDK